MKQRRNDYYFDKIIWLEQEYEKYKSSVFRVEIEKYFRSFFCANEDLKSPFKIK